MVFLVLLQLLKMNEQYFVELWIMLFYFCCKNRLFNLHFP